jgi:heme exporter protein A
MKKVTLKSENVSKVYLRKTVIQNVTFSVQTGFSFAITGKNGSGKSTLIKIMSGLLAQTSGTVSLMVNEKMLTREEYFPHIGFVAPYLTLYEEFTGEENLIFMKKVRGLNSDADERIVKLLKDFNIYDHRKKEVRFYSSGMKQRLKYCAALLHQPVLLFLDEPSANLDETGTAAVQSVMSKQKESGALVFATNEQNEVRLADSFINLDELNKG